MKSKLAALLAFIATVSSLCAHPSGHNEGFVQTLLHMVSTPSHFIVYGLTIALLAGGFGLWIKRRRTAA
ncbi:MAG: hypothetical protein ACON39_03140 [Coraliomargaritaceae bacterium]